MTPNDFLNSCLLEGISKEEIESAVNKMMEGLNNDTQ